MAASKALRAELFLRAKGRCECTMRVCKHHRSGARCPHGLHAPGWDVHRQNAGGPYTPSNCIAMCATCHKNTRSYGRS